MSLDGYPLKAGQPLKSSVLAALKFRVSKLIVYMKILENIPAYVDSHQKHVISLHKQINFHHGYVFGRNLVTPKITFLTWFLAVLKGIIHNQYEIRA